MNSNGDEENLENNSVNDSTISLSNKGNKNEEINKDRDLNKSNSSFDNLISINKDKINSPKYDNNEKSIDCNTNIEKLQVKENIPICDDKSIDLYKLDLTRNINSNYYDEKLSLNEPNIEKEISLNDDEDLPKIIEYYNKWEKGNDSEEIEEEDEENQELNHAKKLNSNSNNVFSKSFESSLNDLDERINRVDNGIKLKRTMNRYENSNKSSTEEIEKNYDNSDIKNNKKVDIETLKKEWSNMFGKLEKEYQNKLDEQQKLNDEKLKLLHEDIKNSILQQQKKLLEMQIEKPQNESQNNNNLKRSELIETIDSTSVSTLPIVNNINTASIVVDNAKYISNLRLELKTKHDRHVLDLKNYYEKEIEDLNKKLAFYKSANNNNNITLNDTGNKTEFDELELTSKLYESLTKTNEDSLKLNSELNEANKKLLDKLSQANRQINILSHENTEFKKLLSEAEQKTKFTNNKISNLEMCVSHLEIQLTDSIKAQDEFIRELHDEKRNLIKKMQECESLKLTIKNFEQKCLNLESKLNQKESMIVSLKQKYVQLEQETNKHEYEYQRSRNNQTTLTLNNSSTCFYNNNKENINRDIISYKNYSKVNSTSSSLSRSNSANSEISSLIQSMSKLSSQYTNEENSIGQHKPRIDSHYENIVNDSKKNFSETPYLDIHSYQTSLLDSDKQLEYIEKLENDFDLLMKHKQQLDSQLTRLPQKITNTSMHVYKENIENELNLIEKKLASTKLELRKLNIIKHH